VPPAPFGARHTAERVKLLFEFSPGGYALSAAVGAATAAFLWGEVRHDFLLVWIASVLLVSGGRYLLYLAYQRRTPSIERAADWERYFIVGSTLMGFAWAALPTFLFPAGSIELQLALTFIVAAMAMGGVGILGPSRLALSLFIAPMALAMVARLLLQGGAIFVGIAVVAIFYVALLVRMGSAFHNALAGTIRARFETEVLIEKLRTAQDAFSDAVESLPEAIAIYDVDDRLMVCNRKYAQAQTTYDDPAQLVGKSFAELVRLSVAKGEQIEPEFAGDVEAWIKERLRRREVEAGREPRMYRIGDGRWMLTAISRTRAGGIVAVRTDITRLREAELSVTAALDEQELIFGAVTTGIAFLRDRVVQRCNRRLAEIFGYSRDEVIGKTSALFFYSAEEWERVGSEAYPLIRAGGTYGHELRGKRRDGTSFWMQVTGRLVDPADEAKGTIWVIDDVDARHRAEEALKAALIEEQRIMDTATVGIVFLKDRKVIKCNQQFASMLNYVPEELVGHSSAIWFPSMQAWQEIGEDAYSTVNRGERYDYELEFVKKNGERLWCHVTGRMLDVSNPARGSIWVYSDVTERKQREEEARDLAHHDALTGLPNRRLLDDRIAQAFAAARRSRERVALMLLDLDRFKPINDTYGHEAGDAVLKTVAARLKGCVRESDTVARVGGDEFVVMLPMRAAQDAVRVADKILAALAEPIRVAGHEVRIGVSIGISAFPEDSVDKDDLLKYADRAMYHVKAAGRNSYSFYAREPSQAQA